jgi:prepilin-type N-terminal cleavage/methylation domain-containing protein
MAWGLLKKHVFDLIQNDRSNNFMQRNEKGFTLIELLVVVAIIGILAAIAIPQFATYRAESFCARVVSDAKNAFLAMEHYYARNLSYGTLEDTNFKGTHDVTVTITSTDPLEISASDDTGTCVRGSGVYTLSSASGVGTWY